MLQVLFVKLTSLGDLFHAMPALSDLKRAFDGQVEIDWLVDGQYAAVPSWHNAVRDTRTLKLRSWVRHRDRRALGEFMDYLRVMREPHYDAVIDAQGLVKSAALGCLPACGRRHGYDYSSAREPWAAWIYDRQHVVDKEMHAVERVRRLLGQALGYDSTDYELDYGVADSFAKVKRRDSVVLIPHAAQPAKLWATERWIELGRLIKKDGHQVEVCWGGPYEQRVARHIAEQCEGEVAPDLGLAPEQIGAYLAGAAGAVSLDTGLAHIAAAVDLPNICLCAATKPERSGAYGPRQQALPHARALDAPAVWARLHALLAEQRQAHG